MKKNIFLAFLLIAANVFAQLDLPKLSPKSTLIQNFGYTTVTVEYHRPDVKGRKIWGGLIPFDKVYRMGANDAATLEFSTDVSINGNTIPAGKYSLYSIPEQNEWTVILNKISKQWGAYNYDDKQDLLRFRVKTVPTNFTESLIFWFSDLTINSAQLNFTWEERGFFFKIETDVINTAHEKIKKALETAKPDDWRVYLGSANFALENNWFMEEALSWTDKSIELGAPFNAYFVKAKILFEQEKFRDALAWIVKTKEKGKDDKNFANYASQVDQLEADIKAKL